MCKIGKKSGYIIQIKLVFAFLHIICRKADGAATKRTLHRVSGVGRNIEAELSGFFDEALQSNESNSATNNKVPQLKQDIAKTKGENVNHAGLKKKRVLDSIDYNGLI